MSTRSTLKFEMDEATQQLAHLYQEVFDEGYVFLELRGFPFEAANSVELSGQGAARIAIRLPNALAQKLGLLKP
jgi:hypothetical protein